MSGTSLDEFNNRLQAWWEGLSSEQRDAMRADQERRQEAWNTDMQGMKEESKRLSQAWQEGYQQAVKDERWAMGATTGETPTYINPYSDERMES